MTHSDRPILSRLARALESAELVARGMGFNMAYIHPVHDKDFSGHECGTVCCIAGWAEELGISEAAFNRELDTCTGDSLIMPRGYAMQPEQFPLSRAAKVVRHAAKTGEVNWDKFPWKGEKS